MSYERSPSYLMVVERDDEERFQLLRRLFLGPRVEIIRDRRVRDRRAPAPAGPMEDRRKGERRAPLPKQWVNLGFLVARRNT